MFDWIPTADEVIRKIDCTLSDHKWITVVDGNGKYLYQECESCGKKKR